VTLDEARHGAWVSSSPRMETLRIVASDEEVAVPSRQQLD
jgi:hypothetical protein